MFMKNLGSIISRCYTVDYLRENLKSVSHIHKLSQNFDNCVLLAAKHIELGGVIAIPTDTVYGLAADAQNHDAVQKLYTIKGREISKPLAICIPYVSLIDTWGHANHLPEEMLTALLPGPVTIVLNRRKLLNPFLNPKIEKVGIRIPKHNFVQQFTSLLNAPIALTSANKSNEMSPVIVDEFSCLWSKLDAVFDNGRIGSERSGSTIVDLSEQGKYEIIRKGSHFDDTVRVLKKFELVEK